MKSPSERRRSLQQPDEDIGALHPTQRPCAAMGCPEIGAISSGGSATCRFHFGEAMQKWPRITLERIRAAEAFKASPPPAPTLPVDRKEIIDSMRKLGSRFGSSPSKDWARRLLAREQAGEKLNPVQSAMARDALRIPSDEELA